MLAFFRFTKLNNIKKLIINKIFKMLKIQKIKHFKNKIKNR